MQAVKLIGRILSSLLTAVLALLLVCNLYTIGVRYFTGTPQPAVLGWSWAVVVSGSMEPEIKVNDLVIVHRQKSYQPGDVITYENGSSVVTHRIVAETAEGFITQGDSNNTEDMNPVPQDIVVGKVICTVPKVGLFIEYLRTPLGMTCMVIIGFLLIEIPYLLEKKQRGKGGRE